MARTSDAVFSLQEEAATSIAWPSDATVAPRPPSSSEDSPWQKSERSYASMCLRWRDEDAALERQLTAERTRHHCALSDSYLELMRLIRREHTRTAHQAAQAGGREIQADGHEDEPLRHKQAVYGNIDAHFARLASLEHRTLVQHRARIAARAQQYEVFLRYRDAEGQVPASSSGTVAAAVATEPEECTAATRLDESPAHTKATEAILYGRPMDAGRSNAPRPVSEQSRNAVVYERRYDCTDGATTAPVSNASNHPQEAPAGQSVRAANQLVAGPPRAEQVLGHQVMPYAMMDNGDATTSQSHNSSGFKKPGITRRKGRGTRRSSKTARYTLKRWRFRKGTFGTEETHLIDVEVEKVQRGKTVTKWMSEATVHREYKAQLLSFWKLQGGRKEAIIQQGGVVDNDTKYLIHDLLDQDGSLWLVEWVGYGRGDCTWEPESAIGPELLQRFRNKSLRSTVI